MFEEKVKGVVGMEYGEGNRMRCVEVVRKV